MDKKAIITPGIISFIMLLVAIPEGLPYSYYILLRWVICASALFIARYSYEHQETSWVWVMAIVAIVFNPFIPIYLDKSTWVFIDLITSFIFILSVKQIPKTFQLIKNDSKYCPECGTIIRQGNSFCMKCGKKLKD